MITPAFWENNEPEGRRFAYSYRYDSSGRKYRIAVVPFEGGPPEGTLNVGDLMRTGAGG